MPRRRKGTTGADLGNRRNQDKRWQTTARAKQRSELGSTYSPQQPKLTQISLNNCRDRLEIFLFLPEPAELFPEMARHMVDQDKIPNLLTGNDLIGQVDIHPSLNVEIVSSLLDRSVRPTLVLLSDPKCLTPSLRAILRSLEEDQSS